MVGLTGHHSILHQAYLLIDLDIHKQWIQNTYALYLHVLYIAYLHFISLYLKLKLPGALQVWYLFTRFFTSVVVGLSPAHGKKKKDLQRTCPEIGFCC